MAEETQGFQLRHKDWGVFQGSFLGLGFWHPMSEQPEQGFYRFETREQAQSHLDFLCSDDCASRHAPDEFTIEPFDAETSARLQSGDIVSTPVWSSQSWPSRAGRRAARR